MNEELPIGPNSCNYCGGEYGKHDKDCRKILMEKQNNKPKYQKNPNEVGCAWEKFNDKNIEYLSIKLELDGKEYLLKGFLNSGFDPQISPNRPKYLVFKSNCLNKKKSYKSWTKLE